MRLIECRVRGRLPWTPIQGLMREWRCCGQVWQLFVTRQYPARWTWTPTPDRGPGQACGRCGSHRPPTVGRRGS
jgi:hypothetical protein